MQRALSNLGLEDNFNRAEEWSSNLSYKILLIEKELGYPITNEMNGLVFAERLRMIDRFWIHQKEEYDKIKSKNR